MRKIVVEVDRKLYSIISKISRQKNKKIEDVLSILLSMLVQEFEKEIRIIQKKEKKGEKNESE